MLLKIIRFPHTFSIWIIETAFSFTQILKLNKKRLIPNSLVEIFYSFGPRMAHSNILNPLGEDSCVEKFNKGEAHTGTTENIFRQ